MQVSWLLVRVGVWPRSPQKKVEKVDAPALVGCAYRGAH